MRLLHLVIICVDAALGEQRLMGAALRDTVVRLHQDLSRTTEGGQAMGEEHMHNGNTLFLTA